MLEDAFTTPSADSLRYIPKVEIFALSIISIFILMHEVVNVGKK
jgi:hypothetical protein